VIETAAHSFDFKLRILMVHRSGDLDSAFAEGSRQQINALIVVPDPVLIANTEAVAQRALQSRVPSIFESRVFAKSGGLISYGPNYRELWRKCAVYTDKILKGAPPATLPVEQVRKIEANERGVRAVAFTPEGARAVTGSTDTAVRLWRVSDGGLIAEMKGHTKIGALAVRSSDSMIASGEISGDIRLWDGNTGQYLRTLANQGGFASSLTFSPDGSTLAGTRVLSDGALGAAGSEVRLYDVATGRQIRLRYKANVGEIYMDR
jgi:WD40 repeat protein